MTIEKAIRFLEDKRESQSANCTRESMEKCKAYDMAIEALKEKAEKGTSCRSGNAVL